MMSKKFINQLYLVALLMLPITLLVLPADFFDNGQAICLSVVLLDMQCYGCGMTRAIQHLIHLDFEAAYQFNVLSFVVFPIVSGLWIAEIRKTYLKTKGEKPVAAKGSS